MHGKTVGQGLGRVDTPIKMNESQILPMMPLSLLLMHNTVKPLIISLLYLGATHPSQRLSCLSESLCGIFVISDLYTTTSG